MNRFSEIGSALRCFVSAADSIVGAYTSSLDKERSKYNEKYLGVYKENLISEFGKQLSDERSRWTRRCDSILNDVQNNLKSWIAKPIDQRTLNTLLALKDSKIQLTDGEISALEEMVGESYFGRKILNGIASENGSYKAFGNNLDVYLHMLRDCKSECDLTLNCYSGRNLEGLELLPKSRQGSNLVFAAADPGFLKPTSAIVAASLIWDGDSIPETRKTRLTEADSEVMNQMFDGCTSTQAIAERAKSLLIANPALKEVLQLSPVYGQFVEPTATPE